MKRREQLALVATAVIVLALYLGEYLHVSTFRHWRLGTRTIIFRSVGSTWEKAMFSPLAWLEGGFWAVRGCEFAFNKGGSPAALPASPATPTDQPP
jgi:hypothetical protein